MVAEAQYGGRITDDLDRELFNTYAAKWFCSLPTLPREDKD
jgi:dynein heavy chain